MIFLIEYMRKKGRIVTFREFEASNRRLAKDSRLEIELELYRKGVCHEVVLMDAVSKDDLRRTHQRYFGDFERLEKSGNGRTI